MALDPEQLGRRIKAARIVAGLDQDDLGQCFQEEGLGKTTPGRLERWDTRDPAKLPFTGSHLNALVKSLGFPERWFTEDDLRIVFRMEAKVEEALAHLEGAVRLTNERIAALESAEQAAPSEVAGEVVDAAKERLSQARRQSEAEPPAKPSPQVNE